MSERTRRFHARQEALGDERSRSGESSIADAEQVAHHKESSVDQDKLDKQSADRDAYYELETDVDLEEAEVKALLADIRGRVKAQHIDEVLESAKREAIRNVVNQFGAGNILTKEFVDTVEYRREHYDNKSVRSNMRQVREGKERDSYTGQLMNHPEADHVHPLRKFHETDGWWLLPERKTAFAADFRNLAVTDRSINRSKGSDSVPDFKSRSRRSGNKDQPRLDGRRTRALKKSSQDSVTEHEATSWDKAKFVTLEGAGASVRMGLQQALGVVLEELTVSLFEEAKDIYRQGLQVSDESFWEALRRRVSRILRKVKDKWKDILAAFGEGLISGFLSLLVEVLLKALGGFAKRVGRLIRESFRSLYRAVKLLLSPPEGMSLAEAAHEATKILSVGAFVAFGLGAEQAVEKLLFPLLGPLGSLAAPVLMGILTGLGAAFIAYGLDKLDIFGIQETRVRKGVFEELAARRETALEEMDETLDSFLAPIVPDRAR